MEATPGRVFAMEARVFRKLVKPEYKKLGFLFSKCIKIGAFKKMRMCRSMGREEKENPSGEEEKGGRRRVNLEP